MVELQNDAAAAAALWVVWTVHFAFEAVDKVIVVVLATVTVDHLSHGHDTHAMTL